MKDFDSILAKARKLAALADEASGATDGERENAAWMLREHCDRYGISKESLSTSARKVFALPLVPDPRYREVGRDDLRPERHRDWLSLGVHTWMFVCGEPLEQRPLSPRKTDWFTPRRKKDEKVWQIWELVGDMTAMEFDDWRACFYHYAPAYADGLRRIRAQMKAIRKVAADFGGAFVNYHSLFPPAEIERGGRKLSLAEMLARRVAASFVSGDTWEPKAGGLSQGGFFLE